MTLARPRTAAECLQIVRLQPHEQEMLAERIEQYAWLRVTEAVSECRTTALHAHNDPITVRDAPETSGGGE